MPEPQPGPIEDTDAQADLSASLRRAHWTVLLVIAGCALVSAVQESAETEAAPDPTLTTLAVALALGVILMRRSSTSRVLAPRTRLVLTLSSYAFAAALAMLGTFVAMTLGATQTGLVFALAAGIFCIRRPEPLATRRRDDAAPPRS